MKVGTRVRIRYFSPTFNGLVGKIVEKDGDYHTVKLDGGWLLYRVYDCEMEVLDDHF